MNKLTKVVLIFMGIFSMILAAACQDQDKAAAERIEESLKEKYGEEFTVEKIGGGYGTLTTNTLKAIVSPKTAPEKKFKVEVTKDLDKVWDDYMNVVMSEKMDVKALEMAKAVFGEDVWVKSDISSAGISFPDEKLKEKNMKLTEYIHQSKSDVYVMLEIFTKRDREVDKNIESQNIDQFADDLLFMGVQNAGVRVYYIHQDIFRNIENEYRLAKSDSDLTSVNNYFEVEGRSYTNSFILIEDSKKEQSLEQIKVNLEENESGGN
ncbi:hypothetical protein [Bacillus sp. REN3]|uniref:hypothetical protein n=1 Tax=Bacillus sp. REN3 TaxID=2802440 RepID=UPI001AEE865A|nr:hypothetical protein [Bacillus sp. REN3]